MRKEYTTGILGIVERTLYTASTYIGRPEFIGGWLVLKIAGNWQQGKDDVDRRALFNAFLSGTGLSLFYGFIGGRMISLLQSCEFTKATVLPLGLVIFSILLILYAKVRGAKN